MSKTYRHARWYSEGRGAAYRKWIAADLRSKRRSGIKVRFTRYRRKG